MEPVFTGDTIHDIVNDVNRGIIFVLCYHKKELENNYIIPTESVVYCDCREINTLDENNLAFIMEVNDINRCSCNINRIVRTKAKFARVTYVKLYLNGTYL